MRVSASLGKCLALSLLAHMTGFGLLAGVASAPARAQTIPKSLEQITSDTAQRDRRNAWTVGIAGGQLSGTYMTFANELAEVLDYFRNQRKIYNLESRVNYIVRLPVSEVHILTSTDVKTIEDLRGKKVSFGPAGSASSLTGTIVFQRLGVKVEQVLVDNASALQKLKSGEIAALVRVIGKPIDFFAKIPASAGLHFVPIPFTKTFADYYTLGELTNKEYPGLVPEGEPTDTIAVPAVLAVFNWQKGSDRYRRVERFTESFFSKWGKFREPPRHPKWRDVNLAATVPGWTRWSVAEETLRKLRAKGGMAEAAPQVTSTDFTNFLKSKGSAFANLTQEQRDAIFLEFLQWQKQRGGAGP